MINAFMFPGQGCQKAGMGLDLYNNFEEAREYFKSKKMTMYNGTGIYREGNVYSLNEFIEAFFEQ